MTDTWQLQHAKARFSELVQRARTEGAQIVTVRGNEAAVVLSIEEYRRLKTTRPSIKDVLLNGPRLDDDIVDFINECSIDREREIDFE
jgi:prevent-host-death family protein